MNRFRTKSTICLLCLLPQLAFASQTSADTQKLDASILSNLEWRNIGPSVTGGRIIDFAVVESNPKIIFAATASGGAWKSTNAGITWIPVFEKEKTVSIGGIAVAASNPNVVWIGTGEPNARNMRSTSWGNGVYKSEDGGKSWKNTGLELSQHIGRIVIHPEDMNVVYVSCLGTMWGNDPERNDARGLFKTIDGGKTWTKVLSAGEQAGIVEVVMDPSDPNRLYAGAWHRERRDWSFFNTGTDGGIFRTDDGGENWERLTNGLPKGGIGRVGLSICRSRPDRLYSVIEGKEGGIYRSDDRGASWEHLNDQPAASMYYGQVRCDPNDPERVYGLQTPISVSDDGGQTFNTDMAREGVHVDHHALWINPADSDHLLLGNDGGIYISYDRGQSFRFAANLPITQFYTVAVDMQEPYYYVYGGTQDNNSLGGPSGTRNIDGIVNDDWAMTVGGDGFFLQIDPLDPSIVFTESQNGRLVRFDTRTGERHLIQPQPPEGEKYRWNWSAPVLLSQHDRQTVYFAAQYLFRSSNRGGRWDTLGPDLTRQIEIDPEHAISDYGTIRIIAESPANAARIGVGTDDGLVQLSNDGGQTWTKIDRFPEVPERAQVSRLVFSAHSETRVYVTFTAHEDNDFRPFVLVSNDYGASWESIAGDLPEGEPVRAFAEHSVSSKLLFAGTEFGVYASISAGNTWVSLKNNLPTVPIHDMVIQSRKNDLVLGTHGRGFWIFDDIQILEEMTEQVLQSMAYLSAVRPALQMHFNDRGRGSQGQGYFAAPNPPEGAIITYYVRPDIMTGPESDESSNWKAPKIYVDVVDTQGELVRRLEPVQGKEGTGIQRLVWDLRHPLAYEPSPEERYSFFHGNLKGPFVLPGNYRVQLKVGDVENKQEVEVGGDPLITLSEEDRRRWHDTSVLLNELMGTAQSVLRTVDTVEKQVKSAREVLARDPRLSGELDEEAESIQKILDTIHRAMSGRGRSRSDSTEPPPLASQIRSLYRNVSGSTAAPTTDQLRLSRESHGRMSEQVEKLNELLGKTLPAFRRNLDENGVTWTPNRKLILPAMPR